MTFKQNADKLNLTIIRDDKSVDVWLEFIEGDLKACTEFCRL